MTVVGFFVMDVMVRTDIVMVMGMAMVVVTIVSILAVIMRMVMPIPVIVIVIVSGQMNMMLSQHDCQSYIYRDTDSRHNRHHRSVHR